MSVREDRLTENKNAPPIGLNKNGVPIRVVVVDDVFIERRIMTQILRSTGFEVVAEASDGLAGLEEIKIHKPQLVILDYYMPKFDGLDTLMYLKKEFPGMPVIMSTSESDKEIATTIMKHGADDYIVKPLDRTIIIKKLEKVVEKINTGGKL